MQVLEGDNRPHVRHLDAIFNQTNMIIVAIAVDERISYINAHGCVILGGKESDILGKNWFDYFVPRSRREEIRTVFSGLKSGRLVQLKAYENTILTLQGQEINVLWQNSILRDQNNNFLASFSFGEEISGNRQDQLNVEQALVRSEEEYHNTLEVIHDAIFVVDKELNIVSFNKSFIELLKKTGYPSINPLGKNLFDAMPLLTTKVRDEYRQVFDSIQTLKTEEKVHIGNEELFAEIQKIPFSERGQVVRVLTVVRDISDRKRAEELKSDIITFSAHELKTPLIPILGWAEILNKTVEMGMDLNKTIDLDVVKSILHNAERLVKIVDNYLDVGRIQADRLSLNREQVFLPEIIAESITSVSHLAKEKNIAILKDIPNISFQADRFRLVQVFINVLSNAIKYSPSNTQVWIHGIDTGDKWKVAIQDQGFGFAPEELEDLFQPFSRAFLKVKGEKVFSGSGVGLFICKQIISLHGGTIKIESPGVNQGSIITIAMPK